MMPKKAFLPVFAILVVGFIQVATAQEEPCAQFSIYTMESMQASPGTSVDIDLAVKNTGTCQGETLIIAKVPEGWSSTKFFTKNLAPGETQTTGPNPLKVSIPSDAKSSTITLLAESAELSTIDIIMLEDQTPIITPLPVPIITPQETPKQQENETPQEQPEPQAQQTSGEITGLVTGNPAVQSAVLVILILGGALAIQTRKAGGFRYRFRN